MDTQTQTMKFHAQMEATKENMEWRKSMKSKVLQMSSADCSNELKKLLMEIIERI